MDAATQETDAATTLPEGATMPWDAIVDQMYRLHFGDLCRVARRLLDTLHSSEEVVQEAFAKFAALPNRPRDGSELAYLRSIVLNEARSTLRHRVVRTRRLGGHVWREESDATGESAVALDEAAMVRSFVADLPLRQRQVVTLRHLVGLSEHETAVLLKISKGSVKTHSSRGLSAIRERLRDVGDVA